MKLKLTEIEREAKKDRETKKDRVEERQRKRTLKIINFPEIH